MKRFKAELKQILTGKVPKKPIGLLPSGFQRIGDIIILNLKPELKPFEKGIGEATLKIFPKIKTVCAKSGGVKGELRLPQIRRIAGNGTKTTHTENDCKYRPAPTLNNSLTALEPTAMPRMAPISTT